MKSAYVQCSPISVSYTNIIHLRQAVRLSGASHVTLCIWDPVVFEDPAFFARADRKRTRMERLQENARIHQRVLEAEGVEVSTIYLSEAWSRLFAKPELARIFNAILTHVHVSDLSKRRGLPSEDISLSRINYAIADFLVACTLHQLFPELVATQPKVYVTSRRLAPLLPAIHRVMSDPQARHAMPRIVWISPFPVLIDSKGLIPSFEMPLPAILRIVSDAITQRPLDSHDLKRLYGLLGMSAPSTADPARLSRDLHTWLLGVRTTIERPQSSTTASIRIATPEHFHRSVRPLSAIKLRILALCDGTRTSYHIAKALGVKQVTVSVYIGRLRRLGLVTEGRRPRRTVSSLVVDLEAMQPK